MSSIGEPWKFAPRPPSSYEQNKDDVENTNTKVQLSPGQANMTTEADEQGAEE